MQFLNSLYTHTHTHLYLEVIVQADDEGKPYRCQNLLLIERVFNLLQFNHLQSAKTSHKSWYRADSRYYKTQIRLLCVHFLLLQQFHWTTAGLKTT